ncbi:MAG: hypothetical protein U1E76_16365 [Planctomycetota bacterium]
MLRAGPVRGLLVIDVASEPPVLVNRLDLDRAGFGIAVTGSNAYVGGAALRIIDLRAPRRVSWRRWTPHSKAATSPGRG